MRFALQLGLCCLLAPGAFAQHGGGHGGFSAGHGGGFHGGGYRGAAHRGFSHRGFGNRGFYGGYGFWPGYWDSGFWDVPYDYGYSSEAMPYAPGPNVTVVYPPPAAPPPVVVNQIAHPVIHEYNRPEDYGLPSEQESEPVLYLIAFRDHVIRPASTYWIQGDTLHYIGVDHKEQTAPLSSVDEDLSNKLNRERHVPFHL